MLSSMASSSSSSSHVVNLVVTTAPLLSGRLRDCACHHPSSSINGIEQGQQELPLDAAAEITVTASDSFPCEQGGVAAVQAYARHFTTITFDEEDEPKNANSTNHHDPILIVPMGDFKTPLATMSRFGFGVNVMIFHNELQWRTWTVPAYTLWPDRLDERALYNAREPLMPTLVSNVYTQPHEPWHPYVKSIHYDDETKLALIYMTKEYLTTTVSQVETAKNLLTFIYKDNLARYQCDLLPSLQTKKSAYAAFHNGDNNLKFSEWWRTNEDAIVDALKRNETPPAYPQPTQESQASLANCFLPVIVLDDKDKNQYDLFVEAFNNTSPMAHVPFAIVDIWGHGTSGSDNINNGELITTINTHHGAIPTWLISYQGTGRSDYHQLEFTVTDEEINENIDDQEQPQQQRRILTRVQLISRDLNRLPNELKNTDYYQDLDNIRQYAREAYETSLVLERGVNSTAMPAPTTIHDNGIATTTGQEFRHCYVGECEFGNLVADAFRHLYDEADVAFIPSFILNGPGWDAREIRYLDLLENLPYTAQRCGGTMTGLALLRVLRNSYNHATLDPYGASRTAGRFLQVSGLQIVYNSELEQGSERIISVNVWDKEEQAYIPLERTRLYTFASNSHLCFTFVEFPELLGEEFLVENGEVPSFKLTDDDIKDDIQEYIYSRYSNMTYAPKLEGRLIDDPTRTNILTMTDRGDCITGNTYWDRVTLDCIPCPEYNNVLFSKPRVELQGLALHPGLLKDELILTNLEPYAVWVTSDSISLPSNVDLLITSSSGADQTGGTNNTAPAWMLNTNESLTIGIAFDPSERVAGTDTSSLLFEYSNNNLSVGCAAFKTRYNIVAQLSLSSDVNTLDGVAAFGYVSAALVILASCAFAVWVTMRRKLRVVAAMQPIFLISLSVGVAVIGSALIPLSIDDGVASERGCDIACMATPWLLSHGFVISVSALYSKLLRINTVIEQSEMFRRINVKAQDVMLPTAILLAVNFVFMFVWTMIDPLRWDRFEVNQQPWNTYGRCSFGEGNVGRPMMGLVVILCFVSLVMTGWQAFRARNISSDLSESRNLGIAVYSWMQLCVVGVPVSFLVDDDNVVAKYSLAVGLILAVCISMILMVFLPILLFREGGISRRAGNVSFRISNPNHRRNTFVPEGSDMGGLGLLQPTPDIRSGFSPKVSHGLGEKHPEEPKDTSVRRNGNSGISISSHAAQESAEIHFDSEEGGNSGKTAAMSEEFTVTA